MPAQKECQDQLRIPRCVDCNVFQGCVVFLSECLLFFSWLCRFLKTFSECQDQLRIPLCVDSFVLHGCADFFAVVAPSRFWLRQFF